MVQMCACTKMHLLSCSIAVFKVFMCLTMLLCRWFEDFDHATWDLAAFYFGKRDDFTCKECVYVESGSGTKWSFLYKFAKSDVFQKNFARQYKQVLPHSCHGHVLQSCVLCLSLCYCRHVWLANSTAHAVTQVQLTNTHVWAALTKATSC